MLLFLCTLVKLQRARFAARWAHFSRCVFFRFYKKNSVKPFAFKRLIEPGKILTLITYYLCTEFYVCFSHDKSFFGFSYC